MLQRICCFAVLPVIIAWTISILWPKLSKLKVVVDNTNSKETFSDTKGYFHTCPDGYFSLPTIMGQQCHPWLTCGDVHSNLVNVKVIGTGAVKRVSLVTWNGHLMAMNQPVSQQYIVDFRYGLSMLKQLQGHQKVIQFIGSCDDTFFTEYHKFGSADQLDTVLTHPEFKNLDSFARFGLCLDYVRILNVLHSHKAGTLVMCDSNDLEKTLGQYLLKDDFTLVLNDVDSLARVNHTSGEFIKCGHRELGGDFVAPEQLWPYETDFSDEDLPPYDEKSDIWKIPEVCNYFIGAGSDALKLKLKLFGIHSACKRVTPAQRPTALEILTEYERMLQNF